MEPIFSKLKLFNSFKFACQRARTQFRGRIYDVWFTTDIPISNGPWKFQGLPGLILEAYDEKREIQFLFDKIEIPAANPVKIPIFTGKKVDFATYKKADEVEYTKWKKKGLSMDVLRGVTVTVSRPQKHSIELEYEQ